MERGLKYSELEFTVNFTAMVLVFSSVITLHKKACLKVIVKTDSRLKILC